MNETALKDAVAYAVANENPATKDLAVDLATTFGAREPFDTPIGPVKERGAASGLVIRRGFAVAEWGDTTRVDMTFSVTKTFLSTVVGLAWQRGLIKDVKDLAKDYMPEPGAFRGTQRDHHLGAPAPADQRLAGHALGQTGLGRPPRGQDPSRLAQPPTFGTGHALQA